MIEITRREFLERFFRRQESKGSNNDKNPSPKEKIHEITRREFLKGILALVLSVLLLKGEKRGDKQKEENWVELGEEYIKSKAYSIDDIFKDVGGPETLGDYYDEITNYTPTPTPASTPTNTPTPTPTNTPTPKPTPTFTPTSTPKPTSTPIPTSIPTPTSQTEFLEEEQITTEVIYRGKPGTKKIAITFDDSANKEMLRKLLDIAKKHNIKMVWFLIGRTVNKDVEEIIREALETGLIRIGNHSHSHDISKFASMNTDYIEKEKNDWLNKFKNLNFSEDQLKLYFRPPGGAGGYRGGDERLLEVLSKNGYQYLCMWDVEFIYTIRTQYNNEYTVENVVRILRSRIYSTQGGNLVLFHFNRIDISAFERVIDELKNNGYEFVYPEELLN